MDLSRVVVIQRTDLAAQSSVPYFTLWIGNIYDATEDHIKRAFRRFGPFVPEASGLNQVVIRTSGDVPYAFVNFAGYEGANAAWDGCNDDQIVFGPPGSDPAIASPRANFLLVFNLLRTLEDTPSIRLSFAEAIVRQIERDFKSCLDTWLEMLRRLPHLFVIDSSRSIILAAAGNPDVAAAANVPTALAAAAAAAPAAGGPGADVRVREADIVPAALAAAAAAAPAAGGPGTDVRPGEAVIVPAGIAAAAAAAPAAGGRGVDVRRREVAMAPAAAADAAQAANGPLRGAAVGPAPAAAPWMCSVCLEEGAMPRGAMVPCGHTFCAECCRQLQDRRRMRCPGCRQRPQQWIPLYGV